MKLKPNGGSRYIGQMARRLAPYIPQRLAQQILHRRLPQPGEVERLQAATIFCDVSGFSEMANELAADGPRGAEELNRALLMTFTAMIGAIHNVGGFVSHFHGDAMLIYIPDDDQRAASRALSCAQFLQNLMQASYRELEVNRASEETTQFNLSMKVGVGYGECVELVVGTAGESLEFVLGGTAVDEAVQAESIAQAGQVVASQTALSQAGLTSDTPYRIVTEMLFTPYAQVALYWDAYDNDQLYALASTAADFMPVALFERLTSDRYAFIAEHRPATSLFVQFEGISFADPTAGEKLQTYYNWARHIVNQYGAENGRVNRILTGDKGNLLHIIFGAPIAPDAPTQALRCALALQREKPDFISQQTIGLSTGQVFACTVGSQIRREYTVVGDVVNLSARLMAHCPPGSVVADYATVQRTRHTIQFQELPAVKLKGFQQAVPIFQAEGVKQTRILRERFSEQERPLIWREAEQKLLLDKTDEALGGTTQVITLHGSVGAEQRRLVSTAVQHWLNMGGRALVGVGQQHMADVPFGIWQGVWHSFFNLQPDMDNDSRYEAISQRLLQLCPACLEDAPLWAEALGALPGGKRPHLNRHTADVQKARLLRLMSICFGTAVRHKPLLILFEDIHWADPLSLVLLRNLVQQLAHAPLCIILTFSTSDSLPREKLPPHTPLRLADLSLEAGRNLVRHLLQGHDIPPSLLRYLGLHGNEGVVNPLFLEESVQLLIEDGILQLNGRLALDEPALAKARMPDTVQSLLLTRLDRVTAVGRTLLQAASVVGRQFDVEMLAQAIAELRSVTLLPLLTELTEARLISPLRQDSPSQYLFQDDLIQEVAYQSIPYSRRQRWHAHIAHALMRQHQENLTPLYPILAYHFSRTDLHEQGLHFALAAAEEARQIYAGHTAVELYNQAEKHLQALQPQNYHPQRLKLQQARASLLSMLGNLPQAVRDAEQSVALVHHHAHLDPTLDSYILLARLRLMQGKPQDVLKLAAQLIPRLQQPTAHYQRGNLGHIHSLAGEAHSYLGQFEQAHHCFMQAHDDFVAAGDQQGLFRNHVVWGAEHFCQQGAWSSAQQQFERALLLERMVGSSAPADKVRLHLGLVQLALQTGTAVQAKAHLHQVHEVISSKGVSWWQSALDYWHGLWLVAQHELGKARQAFQRGLTAVATGSNPDYLPLLLLNLADIAETNTAEREYMARCLQTAHMRARHLDRLHCFQVSRALTRKG